MKNYEKLIMLNEYIYENNGKKIAVYVDFHSIVLRGRTVYPIYDYEHLKDYADGLVYSDVNFYAYY